MQKTSNRKADTQQADEALAEAELEIYCREHPRSPTAQRRPRIMRRGSSWIALLGSTLEDGIAGLGGTVAAALRAFDVQYRHANKSSG
jgi:hypothetical protein